MTYRDLTNIDITLQTSTVSRKGFGIPLFASSHRYFPERVRAYSSLKNAAADLPTDSNAYKALQNAFSASPAPAVVKVGRREADLDLTVATGSTGASLKVFARTGVDSYSVDVEVTGELDEDAVATAIAAAIEGDANVSPLVVAAASTNVVSLDVASPDDEFWVADLSDELSETYNTTESASDLLAALAEEDDDFYFFSADDHSETFVLEAANDIEARLKLYFVSVQEAAALTSYTAGSATDILGKLVDSSFSRTKGLYHHEADTEFPELGFIAANAPYDAGSVLWANIPVSLTMSKNPAGTRALNATEKGYLEARNAAYIERAAGRGVTTTTNIVRQNRVASGEWISNIRGRDSMQVDLVAAYLDLLLSRKGSKIPYTQEGVELIKNTCRNVLEIYVLRNFIKPNYKLNFADADTVSASKKQTGVYDQGSFEAELQGGILFIDVSGTLSLDLG